MSVVYLRAHVDNAARAQQARHLIHLGLALNKDSQVGSFVRL